MIGMFILSLFVGGIIGIVIGYVIYVILPYKVIHDTLISTISGFIVAIAIIITGCKIGVTVQNANIEKDIAGIEAIRQTYTYSLTDERLSGFERIELTKEIMEQNRLIERRKVELRQWWNQWLDDNLVEEFCRIEPIR